MTDIPTLRLLLDLVAPAFFDMTALAALGAPLLAVAGLTVASTRASALPDKLAQQLTRMGALLAVLSAVATAAVWQMGTARWPGLFADLRHWLDQAGSAPAYALWTVGLFMALSVLSTALNRPLLRRRPLRLCLALATAVAAVGAVLACLNTAGRFVRHLGLDRGDVPLDPRALAWPVLADSLALALACAATLGLAYLVLRRNKDDFGRDYYRYALGRAGTWAAAGLGLHVGCLAWLLAALPQSTRDFVLAQAMPLVLAVTCLSLAAAALCLVLARAKSPLRLKALAFVAALLLWAEHTCLSAMFLLAFAG